MLYDCMCGIQQLLHIKTLKEALIGLASWVAAKAHACKLLNMCSTSVNRHKSQDVEKLLEHMLALEMRHVTACVNSLTRLDSPC